MIDVKKIHNALGELKKSESLHLYAFSSSNFPLLLIMWIYFDLKIWRCYSNYPIIFAISQPFAYLAILH
jgi:hypothetical protein